MTILRLRALLCAVAVSVLALPVSAQDPSAQDQAGDPDAARQRFDAYRRAAAGYELAVEAEGAGEEPRRLEFHRRPLMEWSMDNDWRGAVFVWTHGGRPQVVGCVGSGPTGENRHMVFHEFHTLAERPLVPVRLEGVRAWTWSPDASKVESSSVPGAPDPSETAAGRLIQMRSLARRFTVTMVDQRTKEEWTLRLLPQPLYRYPGGESAETDGAVFAWVWDKGTDPEFLLVLETRSEDGDLHWHFTPARFTNRSLELRLASRLVWDVPEYKEQWQRRDLEQPYATVEIRTGPLEDVLDVVETD